MTKKILFGLIIFIVLFTGCKTTETTGQYSEEPNWVSQVPQSATYYYSVGSSNFDDIQQAKAEAEAQIVSWAEEKAINHLTIYASKEQFTFNNTDAENIVSTLNSQIKSITLQNTTLIDKYVANNSDIWVLACFPIKNLDKTFWLCEEKLKKQISG